LDAHEERVILEGKQQQQRRAGNKNKCSQRDERQGRGRGGGKRGIGEHASGERACEQRKGSPR
jgi:hypothetical protein